MDVNRPMTITGISVAAVTTDRREDAELARLAADGDREAAGVLIERYQRDVRRFLRRLTGRDELADDLTQDTFVRLLNYIDRYDPKYPMRTWLLTIARRLLINKARREARVTLSDQFDSQRSAEPTPDHAAAEADERSVLRAQLDAALVQLSEPQREAIVLFHQQELSVQETAEVMGLPVGTVKSHLHRGRAAMRKILGGQEQGEA